MDELSYYYLRFKSQRDRRSATVVPQGAIPVVAPEPVAAPAPAPEPEPERIDNVQLVMRGGGLKNVRERIASFSDRNRNQLYQQFKSLYGDPTSYARRKMVSRVEQRFASHFSKNSKVKVKLTEREKEILRLLKQEASPNAQKDNTYYRMLSNYRGNLSQPVIEQIEKLLNKENIVYSWSVYSDKVRSGISDERAMNQTRNMINGAGGQFDIGDIETKDLLTNVQKDRDEEAVEGRKTYLEFMG